MSRVVASVTSCARPVWGKPVLLPSVVHLNITILILSICTFTRMLLWHCLNWRNVGNFSTGLLLNLEPISIKKIKTHDIHWIIKSNTFLLNIWSFLVCFINSKYFKLINNQYYDYTILKKVNFAVAGHQRSANFLNFRSFTFKLTVKTAVMRELQ